MNQSLAFFLPPLLSFLSLTDKLFGKRLLQAGRHVMSHKSWMKSVPTENCDVLMTFAGQKHVCSSLLADSALTHRDVFAYHRLETYQQKIHISVASAEGDQIYPIKHHKWKKNHGENVTCLLCRWNPFYHLNILTRPRFLKSECLCALAEVAP